MSISICFAALLLVSAIFTYVSPQNAIRQYVVRKDFFTGIKAGEFTVYDTSEKNVFYRVESNYGVLQNIKLISYPSKQEVGRLQAKYKLLAYKADISVLDSQSNQWINGLIQQNIQLLGSLFNIDWNGHRITMETATFSFTTKFRDTNGQLLAQFSLRVASSLLTRKYDVQIFSNQYPDQIYLLGLAARDQIVSSKKSG